MTSINLSKAALTPDTYFPSQDATSRSLSRSPHPYHRRSSSLQHTQNGIGQARLKYSESSDSTESEERATEADDEKGPLKGLPAPPLRGRKGLKGSSTPIDQTPAISPYPSPLAVYDKRSSYFEASKSRKASRIDTAVQERAVEAYKKYIRRRRAEIARRSTETVLLTLMGVAACRAAFSVDDEDNVVGKASTSLGVLVSLYLLFPIRAVGHHLQSGKTFSMACEAGFHIPSRFDPGPLLYPVFLPMFISSSLSPLVPEIIVTNLIIGLSSVPQKLIPFGAAWTTNHIHWVLTLTPMLTSRKHKTPAIIGHKLPDSVSQEWMSLIFPLHQALLATLKYLTSTSLEPAELQLLSAGLINLYLFAASPQAEILKGLLWVGALCLFIFCRRPLSLEVRIARIPSWKFARNKSPKTGLLSVSETLLNMVLPESRHVQSQNLASDDEDYEHLKSARRMVKNQYRLRKSRTGVAQSDLEPILSDKEKDSKYGAAGSLQRSWTTSANGTHPSTSLRRRKHSLNSPTNGLMSLTHTQAQACKWLISGYVLLAVLAIILVVVRQYVSTRALGSHEPFGWAIGYLFGNIQELRIWTVSNNLERWIALPSHRTHNVVLNRLEWVEEIRQTKIGPANMRLIIAGYCLVVLTSGIGIVLRLGTVAEVDTRRKVFHGIMVAMMLPAIFVDPCFVALALILILAIFLLLDLFRASQLPPISKPLTTFLAPYVDGRDYRGPVIVSPIFLLIGCAIPLWLSLAGVARTGLDPWAGWDADARDLSMISGIVCVGMGDAAASLIGRRFGKTKWFWGGGKSLEGSFAFAAAVTVGLAASYVWLRVGGWARWETKAVPAALLKMALAGSGASILESVLTAGNDNVIVPIGLWLLTRGLRI